MQLTPFPYIEVRRDTAGSEPHSNCPGCGRNHGTGHPVVLARDTDAGETPGAEPAGVDMAFFGFHEHCWDAHRPSGVELTTARRLVEDGGDWLAIPVEVFGDGSAPSYGDSRDTMRDNTRRAGWALAAMQTYGEMTDSEFDTAISDILGDLRHLCDAIGYDFAELDDRGYRNYRSELAGE